MPGQKRKCLDLETKISIIRAVDSGRSKSLVASDNGIAPSSLSTILKNKEKLIEQWENNANPSRKRARLSPYEPIETALYKWFCDIRTTQNIPINGPILMGKADEIAKKLNITEFKANSGWLDRFKNRHGITYKTACGESAAVDSDVVDTFLKDLPNMLRDYSPNNIYNVDETGLFSDCCLIRLLL